MKRNILAVIIFGLAIPALAEDGALSANVSPDHPGRIQMANSFLEIEIDLERGARISSFRYTGFNREDVVYEYEAGNGGMAKDLWTTQGWPGEFDRRTFDAEIVKNGPDEAVVRTKTTVTGEFRNKTEEALKGLILQKTFTLQKDSRILTVEIEVINPTDTGRRVNYWSQNALDFDGERKNLLYWRPTRHGVDVIGQSRESEYRYWYIAVPRAGWNGVTNPDLKRGIIFLMDYNSVEQLYDNVAALTVEWMYDAIAIPAGKSWRTSFAIVPTEGFAGYRHADHDIVANFDVSESPAGLLVRHTVAAAGRPLTNVTIETVLFGAKADWKQEGESIAVEELGFTPLERELRIAAGGALPCIVRATVSWDGQDGQRMAVTYEDYYGGRTGRNLNPELLEPIYEFVAPPKQPSYLKPDRMELALGSKPKILFIRGLWAEFQGIDEGLAQLGEVEVVDGWMKKSALGETVGNFPGSYEELLTYNVIILGNVSGAMLGDLGQEMLADYVAAGGGLLLLAGDRTYGQANFTNQRFLDLLPASFHADGDYGRLKEPSSLKSASGHELGKGIELSAKSAVLYAHRVSPKEGAMSVVTLEDGAPALIVTPPDQPKVALVTTLPFGKDTKEQTLYFRDPAWHTLMARVLSWLQTQPSEQ